MSETEIPTVWEPPTLVAELRVIDPAGVRRAVAVTYKPTESGWRFLRKPPAADAPVETTNLAAEAEARAAVAAELRRWADQIEAGEGFLPA